MHDQLRIRITKKRGRASITVRGDVFSSCAWRRRRIMLMRWFRLLEFEIKEYYDGRKEKDQRCSDHFNKGYHI